MPGARVGIAVGLAAVCAGCAAPIPATAPTSAIDVSYRQARERQRVEVATAVYRGLLGKSLYSECEMVPTDSQVFEHRAKRCGGLRAAVLGISRLYLERAATPAFLRPVRLDGRLRWVDLPAQDAPCALTRQW